MISPSSSQTSLSSLKSHLSQDPTISDRIQDQLRDYASCFDQVRDLRTIGLIRHDDYDTRESAHLNLFGDLTGE
ncbi:hypothetical protein BDV33DRAFT_181802 [Aspergillus novoparasiticus]|uniref:Uncharacterized protein n=1 Tax=Aspergillus novoparasiticus TaxID=986946 RepID=A0A5N6EBV5_9EURO|nr:hypothetical protein BDV33DRAFT_181802 [Aspergillus novoparasiticus]